MAKPNLNPHTDREIVAALMDLDAMKFVRVMNGIAALAEKMTSRGKLIAREMSEDEIDSIIRKMQEGE